MSGIIENLTNPVILFFILGLLATSVKSDLKIPNEVSKFLSYFLLFCIGLNGGHELSHYSSSKEMYITLALAVGSSILVPLYVFILVKKYFKIEDSCALAATYGSVSAVTFITAIHYLTEFNITYDSYLIAALALMESPAIIVGISLLKKYDQNITDSSKGSTKDAIIHAFTNGSVLMLLGCLVIGILASETNFSKLRPLTEDLFKGFLGFFMLDMGIVAGKRVRNIQNDQKIKLFLIGILIPLLNVLIMFIIGINFPISQGNFLLLLILASSASYIAVPATMRTVAPSANPGIYTSVALGVTFPFNISIGIPLYHKLIELWAYYI